MDRSSQGTTPSGFLLTSNGPLAPYIELLKPRVMSLVVFTALAGMLAAFAAGAYVHPLLAAIAMLCVALGSGAAGAFNMWYDRDIDQVMSRTQNRPIPRGEISAEDVLFFSGGLSIFSVGLMGLAVGWLAASWLAFSIFFYTVIYTIALKRRTPQNIVIGGAAGAFPPIIGWVAVTGAQPTLLPWLLFLIVFLWTPPHFWALALYRNEDYKKAGVPMLPVVRGEKLTKQHILVYTVVLIAASVAPSITGLSSWLYGGLALALGMPFLSLANRVAITQTTQDEKPAKKLFGYSILYLFALFFVFMMDQLLFV